MTNIKIWGHGLEFADQAGRLFRGGRCLVALKMVKVVAIKARTIREQEKLTPRSIILAIRTRVLTLRSFACSFSVSSSCFSRICSSLNVGLSGFSNLPGVPGGLRADFNGGAKDSSMFGFRVACCSTGSFEIYPNPTSDGWACGLAMSGGYANGDLFSAGPETGELIEVASAKRAVRAIFCDDVDEQEEELEPVLVDLAVNEGVFLSPESANPTD